MQLYSRFIYKYLNSMRFKSLSLKTSTKHLKTYKIIYNNVLYLYKVLMHL